MSFQEKEGKKKKKKSQKIDMMEVMGEKQIDLSKHKQTEITEKQS